MYESEIAGKLCDEAKVCMIYCISEEQRRDVSIDSGGHGLQYVQGVLGLMMTGVYGFWDGFKTLDAADHSISQATTH